MIVDAFLEDYPVMQASGSRMGGGVVRFRTADGHSTPLVLHGSDSDLARLEAVLAAHRETMRQVPHLFPDWVLEQTEPRRFDPADLAWGDNVDLHLLPCGHTMNLATDQVPGCDCDPIGAGAEIEAAAEIPCLRERVLDILAGAVRYLVRREVKDSDRLVEDLHLSDSARMWMDREICRVFRVRAFDSQSAGINTVGGLLTGVRVSVEWREIDWRAESEGR